MLAGLKELKNWVTGMWQPGMDSEQEDYWKIEYSMDHHLHASRVPSPLTYEEESRIKTVKYQ